jgi:hypothetical protein
MLAASLVSQERTTQLENSSRSFFTFHTHRGPFYYLDYLGLVRRLVERLRLVI